VASPIENVHPLFYRVFIKQRAASESRRAMEYKCTLFGCKAIQLTILNIGNFPADSRVGPPNSRYRDISITAASWKLIFTRDRVYLLSEISMSRRGNAASGRLLSRIRSQLSVAGTRERREYLAGKTWDTKRAYTKRGWT